MTTFRAFRSVRRAVLATSVVLSAGTGLAFAFARDGDGPASFIDAWTADRQSLLREREHSTRGRVFIETPIILTPSARLDSLGDLVARQLAGFVAGGRVAHVVPRDTVIAVESAVASEGGWNSPTKRLSRANARIGVMTVLSVRGDSVRAGVVLERLVPASAPAGLSWWSLPRLSRRDSSLPPAALSDRGSLETSPLLTLSEPMARRSLIPLRLAKELIAALDEMRSCSMKQHLGDRSVPWCWRKENEPGMVKGFFAARRRRESTRD